MGNRLIEMITTRICHDLIGSVGAISNGVELLDLDNLDFLTDVRDLLGSSASILTARCKFFRLSFGRISDSFIKKDDLVEIASSYISASSSRNFQQKLCFLYEAKDLNIKDKYARIMLSSLMVLSETLIRGGNIELLYKDDGCFITVIGDDVRLSDDVENILKNMDDSVDITPKNAPAMWLLEQIKDLEVGFDINKMDEKITLNIVF